MTHFSDFFYERKTHEKRLSKIEISLWEAKNWAGDLFLVVLSEKTLCDSFEDPTIHFIHTSFKSTHI